jgi:hypothetical protein
MRQFYPLQKPMNVQADVAAYIAKEQAKLALRGRPVPPAQANVPYNDDGTLNPNYVPHG